MGLLDLLPGRHATFNLTVLIDDIHNVPLVNGSLSVGWRFKKYTSKNTGFHEAHSPTTSSTPSPEENQAAGSDTLQRIVTLQNMITQTQTQTQSQSGGLSSDQISTFSRNSSEYDDDDDDDVSTSSISVHKNKSSMNVSISSSEAKLEEPEGKLHGRLHAWKSRTKNIKKSFLSTATTASHSSIHNGGKSPGTASDGSSPSASSLHLDPNSSCTQGGPSLSATSSSRAGVETSSPRAPPVSIRGRGETAKVPIGDHACSWSQRIKSGIQIPVSRDGVLGERWLKLVVLQHLSFSDSSAQTEKDVLLGQLELNLAEYAGSGPVTRRYLLDEGKTNATLKVCIELEQVGGQREWNPMTTITKGQVSGGGLESLVGHDKNSLAGTPVMSSANLNRLAAEARPPFSRKPSDHSHSRPSSFSQSARSAPGPSTPPLQTSTLFHHLPHNSHLFPSTPSGSSTNLQSLGNSLQHHLLPHSKASSQPSRRELSNPSRTHPSSPVPDSQPRTQGQPTIGTPHNDLSHQDKKSRSSGFLAPSRTEDIIEALFNPFESSTVGPFTIPYSSGVGRKQSDEAMGEDTPVYEGEGGLKGKGKKRTGWMSNHKDKHMTSSNTSSGAPAGPASTSNGDEEEDRRKKNSGEHGLRQPSGRGFGWKTKERSTSTNEIRV